MVHEAEQQAGRTVREIVLGISGGRLGSVLTTIEIELGGRAVGPADVTHALALARAQARTDGVEILHALPVEITLDSSQRLRDARGMVGERLRITVHLVRVASAALYNLVAAIERCHLDVAAVIAAPYAAGLASLSEDEATFGALVLDLGAGVTGVARFADRRLQQLASVPLGAQHVTQDLAFGLSTGRAQAERLKTLYGSVLARAGDARQQLEVPGLGDPMQPPVQIVSRARLTEIIRPRVEEIFQLARARIAPRPAAARRPPPGVDRRRQPARRDRRAGRGDLRHAGAARPRPPVRCRRRARPDRGDHRGRAAALGRRGRRRTDLRREFAAARLHGAPGQAWAMAARELLSTEPKRPAQEEVPWLGDTTEEDVLNDNQPKHAGEP